MTKTALHAIRSLALIGVLVAGPVGAQAPKPDKVADKATVEQLFREYVAAFVAGDPRKIAAYYNEPTMLLGMGKVLSTRAEVETWVQTITTDFQSRGIADLHLDQLAVKLLGQNVALVSAISQRRAKDGAVVDTVAASYVLRRADTGWKIAALAAYPPADFLKLE
jgi:uncharacterized protein (TIGR02246 family)